MPSGDQRLPWFGTIAHEGILTVDWRLIMPGALTWMPPLPLIRLGIDRDDISGVCGQVKAVERRGHAIHAIGWVDEHYGPEYGDTWACGIDILVEAGDFNLTDVPWSKDAYLTKRGQLRGLTIYPPGTLTPAWADASITVGVE